MDCRECNTEMEYMGVDPACGPHSKCPLCGWHFIHDDEPTKGERLDAQMEALDKHGPPDPEWSPPPDLDAMMLFADEGENEHPLLVQWSEFQGEWGLDIRYQYITDDGYTKPTKKGIRIPRERVEEFILNLMEWITHGA